MILFKSLSRSVFNLFLYLFLDNKQKTINTKLGVKIRNINRSIDASELKKMT